jgi:FAD dependent monooxygenase
MIYPGIARVFDQFGILEKIQKSITPIQNEVQRWPDGSPNIHANNLQKLTKAFDMPVILFDRQRCVEYLYDGLPDKSKIRTNARVERIEHTETGVKVFLTDGTFEEGDIVIGADGVHSPTRQLMWDYAKEKEPDAIPESDHSAIFSQYKGMFGVSDHGDLPDLNDADVHIVYGEGATKLLFTQPGIAYWGITWKDEYSQPPQSHKATQAEQEEISERFKNLKMTENLTFGDLYESRTRSTVLNIEEGILDQWHAGRIVLVGDSAHKVRLLLRVHHNPIPNSAVQMTADLGIGANMAIESAVVLCNLLQKTLSTDANKHPTPAQLSALFAQYQSKRYIRVKTFMNLSGNITRMRSYASFWGRLFITRIATLPWMQTYQSSRFLKACSMAPKLEYVGTRTINEDAVGWKLGEKKEKEGGGNAWVMYAIATSVVGMGMYAMMLRLALWA